MSNKRLLKNIMKYWERCIGENCKSDYDVNNLIDNFALSCGIDERKLEGDVYLTVSNMTASQKRKLWNELLTSNIL